MNMEERKRGAIVPGLLLILVGLILLLPQVVPGLAEWARWDFSWPFIIIGVGVFLLVLGGLLNTPELSIPFAIVTGIGLILLYNLRTGDWKSWAYAWALIPGLVGIGIILKGIWERQARQGFKEGGQLLFVSAVLFLIFGSFLGGFRGLGDYWPVLLILAGAAILVRNLIRR
jgi:hypothetical protein